MPLELVNLQSYPLERLRDAIDAIHHRYGKHEISLGPSLDLDRHRRTARDDTPQRKTDLLPGETRRKRLRIPRLFLPV